VTDTITRHKAATITYVIKDEGGATIEQNNVPVGYVHGVGSDLLPVLEEALDGHKVGDIVNVTIHPEDAFGDYDPDLTFTDRTENVPEEYRHVGAQVQFENEQGETKTFIVTNIDDSEVILDGNHPLAGETIQFEVTIHEIRDASEDEIANRTPEQTSAIEVMDPAPGPVH